MYNKVYCSAALGLSSSHFLMQFKRQDMGRVFHMHHVVLFGDVIR